MKRVVLALLVLCGSARAEEARVVPTIGQGSSVAPCESLTPVAVVFPAADSVGVPRNATITIFGGYPGIYKIEGGTYSETIRVANVDPLRTVHFRPPVMPESTKLRVSYEDRTLTTFETGFDEDLAPPPPPQVGDVALIREYGRTHLRLPITPDPEITVVSLRTVSKLAGTTTAIISRAGVAASGNDNCPGFGYLRDDEVCFHATALDAAGNASTEVTRCVRVEKPAEPPAPPFDAGHHERGHAPKPSARNPIILWSLVAALFVLASVLRGRRVARALTVEATPLPAPPVMRIARVLRAGGLATLALIALGVTLGIVAGDDVERAAWYAGAPAALIPLALLHVLRGQRILGLLAGGAVATTDGKGRVFIVKDGRLKSWLVAEINPLPPARVHERGDAN